MRAMPSEAEMASREVNNIMGAGGSVDEVTHRDEMGELEAVLLEEAL